MGIQQKTTYINICSPKGSQKTLLNLLSNNNKCRPPIQNPQKKKVHQLFFLSHSPQTKKKILPLEKSRMDTEKSTPNDAQGTGSSEGSSLKFLRLEPSLCSCSGSPWWLGLLGVLNFKLLGFGGLAVLGDGFRFGGFGGLGWV